MVASSSLPPEFVTLLENQYMPALFWGTAIFCAFVAFLTAWVTIRVYQKQVSTGPESMIGHIAKVAEWHGNHGRVRIQGEIWQAESDAALDLKKGGHVIVEKVEDLILTIRAED